MDLSRPDTRDADADGMAAALREAYAVIADLRARLDEYGWIEGALRRRTAELAERVKELECLHAIAAVLRDPRDDLPGALAEAARIIPSGFQHPARTGTILEIRGREFRSPGFRADGHTCTVDIRGGGRRLGRLRVSLQAAPGASSAAAILPQEQAMLETVAELLGEFAVNRTGGRF